MLQWYCLDKGNFHRYERAACQSSTLDSAVPTDKLRPPTNNIMAPVTRSTAAKKAASSKASGSQSKKPKASAAASSNASAPAPAKPSGVKKGKGRKTNASKTPTPKKSKGKQPARNSDQDDDDYSSELAQAYEIMPQLNNAGGSSRAAAGRPSSRKSNSSSIKSGNGADWERMRRKPEYVDLTGSSPPRSRNASQRSGSDRPRVKKEPESSSPPSPVSVRNAEVFNRPTVGAVRQERAGLIQQLGVWVRTLNRTRYGLGRFIDTVSADFDLRNRYTDPIARLMAGFDTVIGEAEERREILQALNQVQGPLRRAPLGNARGKGKGRQSRKWVG